ncbi:uncharacterized protein PRCAT00003663001 [Priceomyces carsonii]|uniref:uncharacterized protein n=1 Tax=Priceomyces carsonii TaxID=28549 RepID=UPI002ED7745C|nr:unnamed protein product [Priceomyces carsonii]
MTFIECVIISIVKFYPLDKSAQYFMGLSSQFDLSDKKDEIESALEQENIQFFTPTMLLK